MKIGLGSPSCSTLHDRRGGVGVWGLMSPAARSILSRCRQCRRHLDGEPNSRADVAPHPAVLRRGRRERDQGFNTAQTEASEMLATAAKVTTSEDRRRLYNDISSKNRRMFVIFFFCLRQNSKSSSAGGQRWAARTKLFSGRRQMAAADRRALYRQHGAWRRRYRSSHAKADVRAWFWCKDRQLALPGASGPKASVTFKAKSRKPVRDHNFGNRGHLAKLVGTIAPGKGGDKGFTTPASMAVRRDAAGRRSYDTRHSGGPLQIDRAQEMARKSLPPISLCHQDGRPARSSRARLWVRRLWRDGLLLGLAWPGSSAAGSQPEWSP